MSKRFLLGALTAGGMLVGPLAQAQDISTVPPAIPDSPVVAAPVEPTSASQVDDVQRMLAVMYADIERLKADENVGATRVIAVGSGAGAGYLLGGVVAAALLAPVAAGAVTTVGFAEGMSAGSAALIETMGAFSGAYGGALATDNLIGD